MPQRPARERVVSGNEGSSSGVAVPQRGAGVFSGVSWLTVLTCAVAMSSESSGDSFESGSGGGGEVTTVSEELSWKTFCSRASRRRRTMERVSKRLGLGSELAISGDC
jgi:hypothetical protein